MAIYVPLDKPSAEVVLELINVMNPPKPGEAPLTFADVVLQNPRMGEVPGKNTTVDVVALPDYKYPGTRAVHYDRLAMDRFGPGGVRQMDGYYFTIDQLLSEFNATFGLAISRDEVFYSEVGDDNFITINIRQSLAYLPDTKLRIKEGFFDLVDRLEDNVTSKLLSIGTAPLPTFE